MTDEAAASMSDDAFPERERDRYVSRGLAYVILLNGVAALILVAALAITPQSTSDPHRLAWAMMVFGSGAITGLLSSLLAYIGRTVTSHLVLRDLLRVGAIVAAVGSGAAFLTALNMMALTAPESSSTRPKSKPQDQTPAPALLERVNSPSASGGSLGESQWNQSVLKSQLRLQLT
jgi:hypothetical protein